MGQAGLPPPIAALLEPSVYPHPVERVELIETHISWVFLAGDRVYKLKKPVDLGFLDFTTAEAATGGEIDQLGGLDTVRENWEENFAQTAGLGPELLPDTWRTRLRDYVTRFLAREASRFAARVAAGRSRDCHGDLQAQHVCCTDRIQIFDALRLRRRSADPREISDGREDILERHRARYEAPRGEPDVIPIDTADDGSDACR